MREFNTSGPCDPALHYTVMREALMLDAQKKVIKGRFLTPLCAKTSWQNHLFQTAAERA